MKGRVTARPRAVYPWRVAPPEGAQSWNTAPLAWSTHTRKMLQLIKKNSLSAAGFLALAFVTSVSALAQSSSSQAPAVAAPGTVAITPQNALALAAPYTGPKYTNRWEIYGGLNFMNGQAGQNTPVRYNMGGGEVMGTYWLGDRHSGPLSKLGVIADYRFGAGTTPVISPYYSRVLVMQSIQTGGITYQGPKNRYASINYHVLGGGTYGIFNYAVNHYPTSTTNPEGSPVSSCPTNEKPGQNGTLALYCNHMAPYGAVGGSIDFNQSPKLAIRLQPDLTIEHFGTETREFFAISLGAVYRFGKK